MPSTFRRYSTTQWLVTIFVVGLAVRFLAAWTTGGFRFDMWIMGDWSNDLWTHPINSFYKIAVVDEHGALKTRDHLPGDLWFFWLLAHLWRWFGGYEYYGETYYSLLKTIPILADTVVAFLLYVICSRLHSAKAGVVAVAMFFLNPGIIFVSSFWGQTDSVSMALLIAGLTIVLLRPSIWLAAVPFIAWATVIKPPLFLPAVIILLLPVLLRIRSAESALKGIRSVIPAAIGAVIIGVITVSALIMPFDVGLPGTGTEWTIFERAQIALDLYPYKTLAAANFWMLQVGSFDQINDTVPLFWGLTAHDLGNVYLALSFAVVASIFAAALLWARRWRPEVVLAWSTLTICYAMFMVPTRVHERYLFPAIVFVILLAGLTGLNRRIVLLAVAASASFLANLVVVYYHFHENFAQRYGDDAFATILRLNAILNIVIFVCIALIPLFAWSRRATSERRHDPVRMVGDQPAR